MNKEQKVIPLQTRISSMRFSIKAFDALNMSSQLCNALNAGEAVESKNVQNMLEGLTVKLAALPMREFYEQFKKK